MISYYGMPITWPTDDIFGTICILDTKPNTYSTHIRELLARFRDSVQFSLQTLYDAHQKEQAYAETLHTWDTALKAAANAIVVTDTEGIVLWVNPAFNESSGYEAQEAVGQPLERIQAGKHDDAFSQNLWGTIRDGRVWKGEFLNQRKDGSLYSEAATITPVKNEQGDIVQFIAVSQDITELKKLEDQLRHAHKMDAIGQLSAGIAHDFNNMLGGILGASELLASESLDLSEKAKEYVDIIIQSSTRAANLTRKLLVFSRKSKFASTAVDLHDIIEETVSLLSQTLDKNIMISVTNSAENSRIIGDDSQLQNALMNIGINASHAMPTGGGVVA
ncbi:PAS domain-containing protein [Desulfoluna sp.]|uniref:two-component system sensor histidine kinase NtrB n=1 Tax=Desulfoluna sp. TaxID=2045199 RepID=UPI00262BBEB6|nr:PAS domain-containing protein [Desulfoluna sp.]